MKHVKVVQKHVAEYQQELYRSCDGCGEDARGKGSWDYNEIALEARVGENYPEGFAGDSERIDICEKCFTTVIKPLLARHGFVFRSWSSELPEPVKVEPS